MKKKPVQKDSKPKRGRPKTSDNGEKLSEREQEVLNHMKEGETYTEVGSLLFISTETVRTHAHNIYAKLKVKNKTQAINKFYNNK